MLRASGRVESAGACGGSGMTALPGPGSGTVFWPAAFRMAQFVNCRHFGRISPDSLWESVVWITSGFGTGFRVSMS